MNKIKVREVIIVEGKYDLNVVKQIVDGTIITTEGFGIFNNKEKLLLIRRMAESRGVIILTDSDSAGFLIRNYLKGSLPKDKVKQAYIPDLLGKERRKKVASKEGKLGVEGMNREVIRKALQHAGATIENDSADDKPQLSQITKTDLFAFGLSGTQNSSENRKKLISALELPERISPNALLDVLNSLFTREEFIKNWTEIQNQKL